MYFKLGADENTSNAISTVSGVRSIRNSGNYLGLSIIWGRPKKEVLDYLKERIQNKIQGWRAKLLNNAGNEVLIKAIITTIPTYAMSVFKLPNTWYVESTR